ncbi:MAG: DUF3106 domain-containing protein [Burkholderiales bacterium]
MAKAALALIFSLLVACVATGTYAQQQNQKKSETTKPARPMWSELSPQQQHVLGPLAADWENLDTTRRKKWVTIANRYPKMKPDAQERLQTRMQAWAKLSQEERRLARDNYRSLKKLPDPQRQEVSQKLQKRSQSNVPRSDAAPDATPDATGK